MNNKNFDSKIDRLIEEIDSAALTNGQTLSRFELLSVVYEKIFNELLPPFEYYLLDNVKAEVILDCFEQQKRINDFSTIEFLQLQYKNWFKETIGYDFLLPIKTEEDLLAALRECLEAGKPYEMPEEVKQLVEQGAAF